MVSVSFVLIKIVGHLRSKLLYWTPIVKLQFPRRPPQCLPTWVLSCTAPVAVIFSLRVPLCLCVCVCACICVYARVRKTNFQLFGFSRSAVKAMAWSPVCGPIWDDTQNPTLASIHENGFFLKRTPKYKKETTHARTHTLTKPSVTFQPCAKRTNVITAVYFRMNVCPALLSPLDPLLGEPCAQSVNHLE